MRILGHSVYARRYVSLETRATRWNMSAVRLRKTHTHVDTCRVPEHARVSLAGVNFSTELTHCLHFGKEAKPPLCCTFGSAQPRTRFCMHIHRNLEEDKYKLKKRRYDDNAENMLCQFQSFPHIYLRTTSPFYHISVSAVFSSIWLVPKTSSGTFFKMKEAVKFCKRQSFYFARFTSSSLSLRHRLQQILFNFWKGRCARKRVSDMADERQFIAGKK